MNTTTIETIVLELIIDIERMVERSHHHACEYDECFLLNNKIAISKDTLRLVLESEATKGHHMCEDIEISLKSIFGDFSTDSHIEAYEAKMADLAYDATYALD